MTRIRTVNEILRLEDVELIALLEGIRQEFPKNRMARFFQNDYYLGLSEQEKNDIRWVIAPGILNPDSGIGVYAHRPEDYKTFAPFLNRIIEDYHGIDVCGNHHQNNWDLADEALDLSLLHPTLTDVSMRIRIAARPVGVNLPSAQTLIERVTFENKMQGVFNTLIGRCGGRYYSLTPLSPFKLDDETYHALVAARLMFRDMSADPYMSNSGLANDWPVGRGMYIDDGGEITKLVWVGEEDPLRLICIKRGSRLSEVFSELKGLLDDLVASGLELAEDSRIGVEASCPSNIGTGMRVSVHWDVQQLTELSRQSLQAVAGGFGLQVRGVGGETSEESSTVYDFSPAARFGLTQAELNRKFYADMGAFIAALTQQEPR